MHKFHSFLLDLKVAGADEVLIESILEAHDAIFCEGVIDTFREKYLNKKSPEVASAIKENPFNIFTIPHDKYKLYANDFIESAGNWLGSLSYGISGETLPFFYWHDGLYHFTMKKLTRLLNMLIYIQDNDLSFNMSGHLKRMIGDFKNFMGAQEDKHNEFINDSGSPRSMAGHDPVKHMNYLIDHFYGQQTDVRFKDLADRVEYQ